MRDTSPRPERPLAAYTERWPKLEIDVINCHQPEYYGSDPVVLGGRGGARQTAGGQPGEGATRSVGPLEIEDPVPVFFLTVAANTRFVFRCASRSSSSSNVARALQLLGDGLSQLGIGAKTALGYGVMGGPSNPSTSGVK